MLSRSRLLASARRAILARRGVATRVQLAAGADDANDSTTEVIVETTTGDVFLPGCPQQRIGTHPALVGLQSQRIPPPIRLAPGAFVEDRSFVSVLRATLAAHVATDGELQARAAAQRIGYCNINDQRAPIAHNRVADAEDILGTVLLRDGTIVPRSFEPMPTHRLYTANGLFRLPSSLEQRLVAALNKPTSKAAASSS